MRILYSLGYFLDEVGGHILHAIKLCEAFQRSGHEVRLIAPLRESSSCQSQTTLPSWIIPVKDQSHRLRLVMALRRALANQILLWKPDFLYVRPALKDFGAIHWAAKKRVPLFTEINTRTFHDYIARGHPMKALIAHLIEGWELKQSKGILCITEEVAHWVKKRIKASKPVYVTGNGFDPEDTPLALFNPSARSQLNTPESAKVILFVGLLQPSAGLDLVIPLLKKRKDMYLWIIGSGPSQGHLIKMGESTGALARMRFLDWMKNEDLLPFLAATDIALGPLAVHRKKMTEAQPLKVRTFLGSGLPVLIGYRDTRLTGDLSWVKNVGPDSQANLYSDLDELLSLPLRNTDFRGRIRKFAVETLSWDTIAEETVSCILNCLHGNSSGKDHA